MQNVRVNPPTRLRLLLPVLCAALSGCIAASARPEIGEGGATPGAPSAQRAVERLVTAAAAGDRMAMGRVWGTVRGSALRSMAPDIADRRLAVMQCVLRGARVVASPAGVPGAQLHTVPHTVPHTVRLAFGEQEVEVAVATVRARDGRWYVTFIDLAPIAGYCG